MDSDADFTVGQIVALARDASMSSSYKPALLKALVRVVSDEPSLRIDLLTLGDHFLRLYWVQTVVFRLRQAATLVKEPKVVGTIRRAGDTHRVRRLADLPAAIRGQLAREMAKFLKINVLAAFHRSKPAGMAPLYSWDGDRDAISVTANALEFLRRDRTAIEAVSNLWWARYLEKVNELAPRIIEKVERNGAERGSLTKYLNLLRAIDEPECFYCGAALIDGPAVHVDHVIPWSFLLTDPPWDLVLACSTCNLGKSDVLPQRDYLDKLTRVHQRRTSLTLPARFSPLCLPADELLRFYEAAINVEWPSGWAPPAR